MPFLFPSNYKARFAHTGPLCGMSAMRMGVSCPLRGKIGLPTVLNCRAKRLLPGPDGHVPFLFPRFATRRPSRTNPPLCGIFPCLPCGGACYRRSIYGSGVHLQCAVVRLAPAVRWLSSGSSRQKMAFPPWLRILRCSYGETAPEVALHRGLHEVLSVPHRRWKSPL